jgi:Uma2 family endonuclease
MPNTAEQLMSVSEFLAWERDQPERYEFSGGVVTRMTGASLAHVTITMNIAFTLRQSLRGSGYRPFTNDAKVLAGNAVRHPDITVTCSPVAGKDDIVPDPVVVIEIVSPSNGAGGSRPQKV